MAPAERRSNRDRERPYAGIEVREGLLKPAWIRIERPEKLEELCNREEAKRYNDEVKRQTGRDVDGPDARLKGEQAAMRDLEKPIEQLLSDIHEQAFKRPVTQNGGNAESPQVVVLSRFLEAHRRMASMMARVALANQRVSRRLLCLTWFVVGLTVVLVALTAAMVWRACAS